ncbi:hypothetical protein Q5424_02685 [Conexibacter sp. JD483]|uniref:hypothetical protein n=1 Tax=unclassified Conexibacter TaxID=2627773 RepID=UPI0027244CEC|nr:MULTISPECIES: hypothetical protein [unclassified Conexibacter]MDO8184061.1 hypothetical protein [Conexibacter sp. CPCC 205706]MDO8197053.1 hypothetical protein [Conexibacter sp. CPCC 205762]MDR9367969.1 hypothetical protein [Conexibacter sp. JD483]
MSSVCLVHLVWAPLGAEPLERFLRSYSERPPGLGHRLVVVLNGFADGPLPAAVAEPLAQLPHEALRPARAIQDLAAYRLAAGHVSWADSICFVNSHAQPLADGWLALLHERLQDDGVGIVGATGSHESTFSAAPRPLKPLRALQYPPFPNPHLRTNSFMLRRADMLALDWRIGRSKSAAHQLESGKRGITRQLAARGLRARVVDRDGVAHPPEQWAASRTFRSGDQERLLVADNRTRQYADAPPAERERLARMAWGEAAVTAVPRP